MNNRHIGSTLQSLFDELGEGEEFRLVAQKKAFVIAAEQRMAALKMSKNALAKRMGTSRPAIDRLLNPNNTSLTFASLNRATQALGLDFSLAFFEAKPRKAAPRTKKKASQRQLRKGRSATSRAA
jgi:antitoxin HicB